MKAVQREERELLFADFIKEKEKKERDAKKAERRRRTTAFRALLEKTTSIKVQLQFPCTWSWAFRATFLYLPTVASHVVGTTDAQLYKTLCTVQTAWQRFIMGCCLYRVEGYLCSCCAQDIAERC